jgi:Spy/CpxP family protein refolding chaperone
MSKASKVFDDLSPIERRNWQEAGHQRADLAFKRHLDEVDKRRADRQALQYKALRATIPQLAACSDIELYRVLSAVARPKEAMKRHAERVARCEARDARLAGMSVDER